MSTVPLLLLLLTAVTALLICAGDATELQAAGDVFETDKRSDVGGFPASGVSGSDLKGTGGVPDAHAAGKATGNAIGSGLGDAVQSGQMMQLIQFCSENPIAAICTG